MKQRWLQHSRRWQQAEGTHLVYKVWLMQLRMMTPATAAVVMTAAKGAMRAWVLTMMKATRRGSQVYRSRGVSMGKAPEMVAVVVAAGA
jgi:hypothetical protein